MPMATARPVRRKRERFTRIPLIATFMSGKRGAATGFVRMVTY